MYWLNVQVEVDKYRTALEVYSNCTLAAF